MSLSRILQISVTAAILLMTIPSCRWGGAWFPGCLQTVLPTSEPNHICFFLISDSENGELREIHALVNERDFRETSLRSLARQFFDAYPTPNKVDVALYSNLEQVKRFVNNRPSHAAELFQEYFHRGESSRYARALLFRMGENEVIRFWVPDGGPFELRTIVLRVKDPY